MKQIVIQEDTNLWYTVKDMCSICNVSRQSWENFKTDFLSKSTFTQKNIKERPSRIGGNLYSESVLKQFQAWLMRNQANQGKSSDVVKAAATTAVEGFKYTKEDICGICGVSETTFKTFVAGQSIDQRDFIVVGSNHKKLYSESVLKQFQMWLMRNQANQGRTSDVVKAAATTALNTGISLQVIIASGNEEAFNEYVGMAREAFNTQRNLKLEQQKNQQLQLEVDKYVQWMSASQIKKEYRLPAKPGITKVAQLLGLKRNEDWIEKNYGDDTCFTKILYSPSAVKLIVDWHFDED